MSEPENKLYSVGEIFLALVFCLIISFFIYVFSILFIFGLEKCPAEGCRVSTWNNIAGFAALLSPIAVFALGAYFARNSIYALVKSKSLRILSFLTFAFLPLIAPVVFIAAYAIFSKN